MRLPSLNLLSKSLLLVSATTVAMIQGCGANGLSQTANPASAYQSLFDDTSARTSGDGAERGPVPLLTNLLSLTDEQQAQVQDIFDRLHTDMQAAREAGRTEFESLLTAEQIAKLEEIRAEHEGPDFANHAGPPPFPGFRPGGPGFPPPFSRGADGREAMQQAMLDRLTADLGLSEDQVTQIAALQDAQHAAAEARRQQAKDELRAILTPDQIAILDQIETMHP
jgi:Spy/CpxP family protein refolding chaperone